MTRLDAGSICVSLLVAAALALLPARASDAVVYTSSFDPVDFRGFATFDVSPGCLSAGAGLVNNDGAACTVTWLGAQVTLIDVPHTVTFGFAPFLPSATAVASIWVQAGELAGVNSSAIGAALVSGHPHPALNGPWWIEYLFGPLGAFGYGIVNLYTGQCRFDESQQQTCVRNPDPVSVANVEGFTRQVPEPATLALVAVALAAIAWPLRRRSGA